MGSSLPYVWVLFLGSFCLAAQDSATGFSAEAEAGRKQFGALCASCHGADGTGGERGPDIVTTRSARRRSGQDLAKLIREGVPDSGMPPFDLPEAQMKQIAAFLGLFTTPAAENPPPGDVASGKAYFFGEGGCGSCHMISGRGGLGGPPLSNLGASRTVAEIESSLLDPDKRIAPGFQVATVRLRDGRELRGFVKNESNYDLQLQTSDGELHGLTREEVVAVVRESGSPMPPLRADETTRRNLIAYLSRSSEDQGTPRPPSAAAVQPAETGLPFERIEQPQRGDWPTYHGRLSGNRHSPLDQIHPGNVQQLAPRWVFPIGTPRQLQTTPLVVDGIMYVTAVNQAYALDAGTGREIWHYQRPRTPGVIGDAGSGINRGAALLGDRLFLVTDNAHLIALHRVTGELLWDVEMADSRDHYGATSAPLVVNDLVVSGISGGDEGVRGFLAAYRASTGERVWRFWTVPAPGEPLSETWAGGALPHGCAATWLTGSYDPQTNLLFWPTGNPCPDYDGNVRSGDNLYSNTVLALEPETGKLRWHYQFTPHDLHDWDATETLLLADAEFHGKQRQLLLQANRNGFFYVLDRANGEVLLAKPFVRQLTWATGIGEDGRPQRLAGADPTPGGVRVCPAVEGATNWMSSAYSPQTGLFYVMALEKCTIYTRSPQVWERGKAFYGGTTRAVPGEPGKKYLRAINPQTGEIVWEYPQIGPGNSWGGVVSTAGGVLFFGDDSGAFAAVDGKTGRPLWSFHTNVRWKASPMTYLVAGRQYVAVAADSNIFAFTLPRR